MTENTTTRYCNGSQHADGICPGHVNECTCTIVDPKYWTTHYGAVEPGSMWEPNPDCPIHF